MNMIRALVSVSILLAATCGASPSIAQSASSDLGYVEAVSGRVVAFVGGAPALAAGLDVISERTRFDLMPNSELRLCHYGTRHFLTVQGPARVTVSGNGIAVEPAKALVAADDSCGLVQTSKFQGGLVARGLVSGR